MSAEYTSTNEDWELLQTFLPPDWQQLAVTTLALKGLRQDKGAVSLLRTLLLHVGCGFSLRDTAVRAQQAGLADLSAVAVLKRLRKSEAWLQTLAVGLWQQRGVPHFPSPTRRMRLIDATTIKEPGPTGSLWRLHYSLQVPSLRCDFFKLTPTQGEGTGEGLWQIPVVKGDFLIADRGYCNAVGIGSATQAGAYVLVRLNYGAVRWWNKRGKPFDLLPQLQQLKCPWQVGSWDLILADDRTPVAGRVCALRKTQAAIAEAQRKLRQEAKKTGKALRPETLEYAKFVTVFTTFPVVAFPAVAVLEWYRVRWQVELVFKRFKSIAGLGHMPKYDEQSARAWLYGKLVVALLTEKLVQQASALSPWGYELTALCTERVA
jgi:hypothetical protein